MKRRHFLKLKLGLAAGLLSIATFAQAAENPKVLINTSEGAIMLELYPEKAPKTVENFLGYVNDRFYDGTIFHRVIGNFMIQGGGFDEKMNKKLTKAPILNEADNGLRNRIGTIAMARTNDPHSATAQFFINVSQNTFLDHKEKSSSQAWGYTVFGKVIKGMSVVNKIRQTRTGFKNGMADVPTQTIKILKVRQVN
ncbi:peptidylprolyl isomerase [Thiomicrorhabdus indica]|uniref:peptidylprolyl isomerase n=1 Tax=Thiomicrorhabdus indica TaxID=2267253 RepID=UPI00102D6DBF|nr:peptidylprolyl isomerase [Thiomicrorhabdus indica]